MSRSLRQSPFMPICGNSDKWYKVMSHRRERKRVNQAVDLDALPGSRRYGNRYYSPKDGYRYQITEWADIVGVDPDRFMRK